jgi:hypothetical protein
MTLIAAICNEARAALGSNVARVAAGDGLVHSSIRIKECKKQNKKQKTKNSKAESNTEAPPLSVTDCEPFSDGTPSG